MAEITSIKSNIPADAVENCKKSVDKKADKKAGKKEKDLYIDTSVRKLGYLDEIGEALRPVLSISKNPLVRKLPNFAYIPATAYVIADVADKYKKGEDGTGKKPSVKMAIREGAFQSIASIIAPMMIVKGTNSAMGRLFKSADKKGITASLAKKMSNVSSKSKLLGKLTKNVSLPLKIASAAVSLLVLSKLIKPVDWACKKLFNNVVDPLMGIGKEKNTKEAKEVSK